MPESLEQDPPWAEEPGEKEKHPPEWQASYFNRCAVIQVVYEVYLLAQQTGDVKPTWDMKREGKKSVMACLAFKENDCWAARVNCSAVSFVAQGEERSAYQLGVSCLTWARVPAKSFACLIYSSCKIVRASIKIWRKKCNY